MEQIIDIFRFFTIAQILVVIALLVRASQKWHNTNVAIMFCLGLIGYLMVDWFSHPVNYFFYIFLMGAIALPFTFYLFSKVLFDDDFRLKPWMIGVLVLVVMINLGIFLITHNENFQLSKNQQLFAGIIAQSISLLFIVLALIEAFRNRSADLIEKRLEFRNWFIFSTAIIMGFTVLVEIAYQQNNAPAFLDLIQKAIIFGLTFYFSIRLLEFKDGFFKVVEEPIADPPPVDKDLVNRLMKSMEKDKIYHTEGLSIRQLATHLEVKEYLLRQTINQHLGFRNFNDFLNQYRIQEACDLLNDGSKKDHTILEIAFEVGYKSLAPFNKAFKQITGKTPTVWRKENPE